MKKSFLILALAIMSFSTYSCRNTNEENAEDSVEQIGDDMEDAADEAGDEIEDAAEDTEDAADSLGNEMEDEANGTDDMQ